jgi:cytosine/adenosine deaminase-related metal-dependent hydrolase
MATVNGAKALGLSGLVGSIEPGAYADFSVFNYSGPITNAIQDVLSTPIYPSLTFIGGKPVYRCSNL